MSRLGMFCFLGRGHLDPAAALGRCLVERGHEVIVFHRTIAQAAVRAEGLSFCPIDRQDDSDNPPDEHSSRWRRTVHALRDNARHVLREAAGTIDAGRIDALIIDQMDLATPSVAERLGIPFVTLSCTPPVFFEDSSVPLPYFGWRYSRGGFARGRNKLANAFVRRVTFPVLELV